MIKDNYKTSLRPGSAILTTLMILFGMTVVAMIGIEIVMGGLVSRRVQGASTKSFYSAESGIERAISLINLDRQNPTLFANNKCASQFIDWDASTAGIACVSDVRKTGKVDPIVIGTYNPEYWTHIQYGDNNDAPRRIILNSGANFDIRGDYERVSRQLYVSFCLPDCTVERDNRSDGCGGTCL